MDGERDGQADEARRDLLQHQQIGEEGLADAPEAFFVGNAAQSHLTELAEEVAGELVLLLEARRGGGGPVGYELPDGADDLALFAVQAEVPVHGAEA